jgi:hypothetical protein
MAEKLSVECHYLDGCAIEYDYIYLAAQMDALDPDEYLHTMMTGFDAQNVGRFGLRDDGLPSNGWAYHDLKMHIVSVCVKKATPTLDRLLCALSKEGEVNLFSGKHNKSIIEKIPDAGLRLSQCKAGLAGYVTHIREIAGSLYVCGMSGQIYKRTEAGWVHVDQYLFKPTNDPEADEVNSFNCIDGNAEDDIYVVGDGGLIFHFNGYGWAPIAANTNEHLLWVRCYGRDEVYICGKNGTLLRGSVWSEFRDVSAVEDNLTWWCLCKFRDKVYLSSTQGLYAWDGQTIARVKTGLTPEIEEGWRVDADPEGKVLWTFGTRDLAWFDGRHWTRLHHPDNPRIGDD